MTEKAKPKAHQVKERLASYPKKCRGDLVSHQRAARHVKLTAALERARRHVQLALALQSAWRHVELASALEHAHLVAVATALGEGVDGSAGVGKV